MTATHLIKLAIYEKPFRAFQDERGWWQAENGTIINTDPKWVEWAKPLDRDTTEG